jgi:hypothetical protein
LFSIGEINFSKEEIVFELFFRKELIDNKCFPLGKVLSIPLKGIRYIPGEFCDLFQAGIAMISTGKSV